MRALAIAVAVGAAALGVWRGTWAVGGSDSSCYALMAQAFARGAIQPTSLLAIEAPWPNRSRTLAPGGFVPSPSREDAASPVCAPGFALLLAPFYLVGGADAIFIATPMAGLLLVYLTFVFGRRLAGETVGLAAAVVVATTPVFIFQIVQPMNDVAVAAIWMAIVTVAAGARPRYAWIGVLTGVALLVRPNLAPAAIVVGIWCLAAGWRRAAGFCIGAAPFVLALLLLNTALYGRPFQSGYGPVSELFSIGHAGANVRNYGRALLDSQLAFPLIGFAATLFIPAEKRRVVLFSATIAAAVGVVYLLYRPLPEWWYLRFLLPVLPILTVLAFAAIASATRRPLSVVPVVLVLVVYTTTSDAMQQAMELSRLERRFRTAAAVAHDRLPPATVFLTVWESGSVRYHADREAVLWDSLDASALDLALTWLRQNGREPYILIEDWEEPAFREKFSQHSSIGGLDWPPRFDIERRVRIYRPADRDTFFRGGNVPTEVVRPDRP